MTLAPAHPGNRQVTELNTTHSALVGPADLSGISNPAWASPARGSAAKLTPMDEPPSGRRSQDASRGLPPPREVEMYVV